MDLSLLYTVNTPACAALLSEEVRLATTDPVFLTTSRLTSQSDLLLQQFGSTKAMMAGMVSVHEPLFFSFTFLLIVLSLLALWHWKQVRIRSAQLEKELADRHRIERQLHEREEQYRIYFEESRSVMLLIEPLSKTIVAANPAACSFYRYSAEEITGLAIRELSHHPQEELCPDMSVLLQQQHRIELIQIKSDGSTVPVEIHCSEVTIHGEQLLFAIVHDISRRKEIENTLEQTNEFLQAVIDGVSDPLQVISTNSEVLKMNKAAREQRQQLDNQYGRRLIHASLQPCNTDNHFCPLQEVKETGQPATVIDHIHLGDEQRIIELNASPLFDRDGQLKAVIEVARDITKRLQIEELLSANERRLHHLAHHDSLTNLPNRLLFDDRLKQSLSKARRNLRQVALFFLDIDNFKAVNDNLGHNYGDMLLIDVAKRLRQCVREGDTVARMGGDEFLILVEDIEALEIVEATAKRICKALNHELTKDQFRQQISASIGISIFPEDANTPQQLMKTADLAMYRVKKLGKANYQFYSEPQGRFIFD